LDPRAAGEGRVYSEGIGRDKATGIKMKIMRGFTYEENCFCEGFEILKSCDNSQDA
jgi:hypothetical protein